MSMAMHANTRKTAGRKAMELTAIAAAGLACVLVAGLATGAKPAAAPLFPLLRGAVEGLNGAAPALLLVLGAVAGLVTRLSPTHIGLASVAALPLAAFAEILADRTSHNLIPFELVMYLVLALPAMIGAALAVWIQSTCKRLFSRSGGDEQHSSCGMRI